MNIPREIEQQQNELKELLQTVMSAPLSPIKDSINGMRERLEELEQGVKEMRDDELGAFSSTLSDVVKKIKDLEKFTKEYKVESIQQMQLLQEQIPKENLELSNTLGGTLANLADSLNAKNDELSKAISIGDDNLQKKIDIVLGRNENSSQQVQLHMQKIVSELEKQMTQQFAPLGSSLNEIQRLQGQPANQLDRLAIDEIVRQVVTKVTTEARLLAKQQSESEEWHRHKLQKLQDEQQKLTENLEKQVKQSTYLLRNFAIATCAVVGVQFVVLITFLSNQFKL